MWSVSCVVSAKESQRGGMTEEQQKRAWRDLIALRVRDVHRELPVRGPAVAALMGGDVQSQTKSATRF